MNPRSRHRPVAPIVLGLDGVARIELVGGKGFALIDNADAAALAGIHFYRHTTTGLCTDYVFGQILQPDGTWRKQYLHRLILSGAKKVDHANGDGFDNRRANLREATSAQNNRNRRLLPGRRFKGVRPVKNDGFMAVVWLDNRPNYIGFFRTEMEAAIAYDAAARELFGEFARPNFPEIVLA